MGIIHVTRIEQKVIEFFGDKIDMNDYIGKKSEEVEMAKKSRAIAAQAISMYTGATVEICAKAITDGFDDMGIDAIYDDIDTKTLYLVQAKWISSGNGSPAQGDILKFIRGFKKILNFDLSTANDKVKAKQPDISHALYDSEYSFALLIVYTGSQGLSKEVKDDLNGLLGEQNDVSEVVKYIEINQKKLYDSVSIGADASPINIDDIDIREWGKISEPYLAYYGCINADILAKWWEEYGNRLFAKNIRFFKGSSEANEGMLKTLNDNPNDFWYFNNGIKILCDSVSKKPIYADDRTVGLFTANGISIVNGAQTVGAIGNAFSKNPEQIKKARVLIELISLEKTPDNYDSLVTKLSNTQNRIDGKDFAALDPEQERIRRDAYLDGVTYIYKGVTKQAMNEGEISIDEAMGALVCFNKDIKLTTLLKRNAGAFFEDITKHPYMTIFNASTNTVLLINVVNEIRKIENLLSEKTKTESGKDKLILIHGNRFLCHMILQLQENRDDLSKSIMNYDDLSEISALFENILKYTKQGIQEKYSDNYMNSLFKNNQKCDELKKYVESKMSVK